MRIVDFNRGPGTGNLQATLEVLDKLREDLVSGRVTAFYAVSIDDADSTECWCGATKHVTRLRMQGAVSHLLHCLHTGDA